jgi:cysteinyl-tRNA synthetase
MHNGFLQVEGEKMSKSLGNFFTIRDLLKDWPGEVLRFNMLRTHYRQPIDWTLDSLKASFRILERWYDALEDHDKAALGDAFLSAMFDDLNTPQAITELHLSGKDELAGGLSLLGFRRRPLVDLSLRSEVEKAFDVVEQINARNAARKAKNFNEADRIRDELAAKGIVLKDSPTGTTWEVKR